MSNSRRTFSSLLSLPCFLLGWIEHTMEVYSKGTTCAVFDSRDITVTKADVNGEEEEEEEEEEESPGGRVICYYHHPCYKASPPPPPPPPPLPVGRCVITGSFTTTTHTTHSLPLPSLCHDDDDMIKPMNVGSPTSFQLFPHHEVFGTPIQVIFPTPPPIGSKIKVLDIGLVIFTTTTTTTTAAAAATTTANEAQCSSATTPLGP